MQDDWSSALFTAVLLAPPSILGIRALFQGPTRFAGRAVPKGMDRVAAAVWLSAFPLTLVIVITRIYAFPPRTIEEANYLANDWGPLVMRVTSIACMFVGGVIALVTAKPEPEPTPKVKGKVKGKSKARYKKRNR